MAEGDTSTGCPACERLKARVAELEAQLAAARKHSGNSSKPPSSDIVKPPKGMAEGAGERKIGGQPGHPRHDRPAFAPDLIDASHDSTLDPFPDCGGKLKDAALAPKVIQQVEIRVSPLHIEEHRGQAYWCPKCQQAHYAPLPAEVVKAGLVGPRLTALVG
jgi:transposase